MTRKHHGRCVRATATFKAPAADVWRAWADPEHIAQWFVDRAEGTCRAGEVMTWTFDAFQMRLPLPVLEAEPGKRLVTGADAGVAGPLPVLMEVDIETQDGGTSVLRLVNSGFSEDPDKADEAEGVRSGWEMALGTLGYWLDHGRPMGRLHHLAMRPTTASWRRLASVYADRGLLARADALLSNRVLADSGRELLLEWPDVGVVGVKAFAMGPQRMIALDVSAWHGQESAAAAAELAVDRLLSAIQEG